MTSTVGVDSFASLSVLRLSSPSHLLPASCNPDKDLLLIVSRLGVKDTISLWKMQGGKKWEVDVSVGNAAHEEVTGAAWSPDGMSVLISHHPPRLSIHSIQDGRQERSVFFPAGADFRVTGVWWHKHQNPPTNVPEMPDFFKRNKTIPGSALSQLKMQPLLDPLKDDTQSITTSDLFSFQGTPLTSSTKAPKLPPSIADWPALPLDPITASIKPFPRPGDSQRRTTAQPEEVLDDIRPENSVNYDSLVVAADDQGRVHLFMDGTFPLGHLELRAGAAAAPREIVSLFHPPPPHSAAFLAHVRDARGHTNVVPLAADLSVTRTSQTREVASVSSAARELAWYMLRVMDEMRAAWVGSAEHGEGARAVGPRWVRELEDKQRAHSGWKEPFPILDLMLLLTTGRASDALSDMLAVLSERGLSKWETTVTDALVKLRDFAEKRIALAAQRLHIILQEAKGWAMLPQRYEVHQFDEAKIDRCLELVDRAIELSAWLAATARDQLWRFKEFKLWLYFETGRVHTDDVRVRPLSWDVLEVDRYLTDGLAECSLDKWFDGEGEIHVPEKAPSDVRAAPSSKTLEEVMAEARRAVDHPEVLETEYAQRKPGEIEHLDRNLEALVREIARSCREVFERCGTGVGARAVVHGRWAAPEQGEQAVETLRTRERTTVEDGVGTQYVLSYVPRKGERAGRLCLSRMRFAMEVPVGEEVSLEVAAIECRLEDGSEVDVLDFEFFDEELFVVVLAQSGGAGMVLGTVAYRDVEYVAGGAPAWREGTAAATGMVAGRGLALAGARRLGLRGTSGAGVAVNGRAGRRTVCVVDGRGAEVEVVDMAGDEEGGGT